MLPRNIDRKRIYQEEVYRYEVRAQLDKANRKETKLGEKVWAFMNSAFFLWFLSSVVLGVISFSYAKWDKQRGLEREQRERAALAERENAQVAKKLDAEISSRLNYFVLSQNISLVDEVAILETGNIPKKSAADKVFEIPITGVLSEDGIMSLNNPSLSNYKFGDPEYSNRSLRLLLLDLEKVVPSEEKNEIALVYQQSLKSESVFLKAIKTIRELKEKGKPGYIDLEKNFKSELEGFCKSFNLKRWGEPVPVGSMVLEFDYK
jgi:hypothetical protein